MSILHNAFFFILAIGVLVTFHEFGHFWVARKAGVKVLRFSVGFGKPLLRWVRRSPEGDDIEYVIAAIPLGGYVKMLDEREGEVSAADLPRAFNRASVWRRIAIVFAGPAFNFMLAIVLYWLVFMLGVSADRAFIGDSEPGSIAAEAGFQPGEEVLAVGDAAVNSWNDFRMKVLEQGLDGGRLEVRVRTQNGGETTRVLPLGDTRLLEKEGDIFAQIGFAQWWPSMPLEIGGVVEGSAAEAAGLREGDLIIQVDGKAVSNWRTLVEDIRARPGQIMEFTVLRDGSEISLSVVPQAQETEAGVQGRIGAWQHVPDEIRNMLVTRIEYGPLAAMSHAVAKTWDMSWLTLRVLWKMLVGEASLANISGPITIASYAGVTASIGLVSFLSFLAVISVSLGVLNLLPVPMLDGGHLLYYLIEIITGSPVSEAVELRGQQVGILLLAMLMSIAIFNDIQRLLQ